MTPWVHQLPLLVTSTATACAAVAAAAAGLPGWEHSQQVMSTTVVTVFPASAVHPPHLSAVGLCAPATQHQAAVLTPKQT